MAIVSLSREKHPHTIVHYDNKFVRIWEQPGEMYFDLPRNYGTHVCFEGNHSSEVGMFINGEFVSSGKLAITMGKKYPDIKHLFLCKD